MPRPTARGDPGEETPSSSSGSRPRTRSDDRPATHRQTLLQPIGWRVGTKRRATRWGSQVQVLLELVVSHREGQGVFETDREFSASFDRQASATISVSFLCLFPPKAHKTVSFFVWFYRGATRS
jgi:hypothetical protein